MKKLMLIVAVVLMSVLQVNAQTTTVADKEILGAWTMEWMQYDGEEKKVCGKQMRYTSFKYYGADGEYACCEIVLSKRGEVVLLPHEYGTYTYKNGRYSEMGRPVVKPTDMWLEDKTHFKGRWMNRTEAWVKNTALSEKAVRFIVDCCKMKAMPADIQQHIKENMFK